MLAAAFAVPLRHRKDYVSPTDEELMDEILGNTVFSRDHNKFSDNSFLAAVFDKWSQAGTDKDGNPNGKRVLDSWTAQWAAKDILREWKGMKDERAADADNYVQSD